MNKSVLYHFFEHWDMGMDGCERAALDDAARSFRCHQIGLPGLVFAAGLPGLDFS